jgi:hypothetical protein
MDVARILTGVLGGVAIVGAGVPATAGVAWATAAPATIVNAALSAGQSQPSVRWVSTATSKGIKSTIVTDAGHSSGEQTILWTQGKNSAFVTVELVNGTGYLIGSAGGLYAQGFTTTAATKEAGKWVSLTPSTSDYAPIVSGLTTATTMEQMQMTGEVTAVPAVTIEGHTYPGFRGTTKPFEGQPGLSETIYVSSTGSPLPVKAVQDTATTLFGNWGEAIKVTVPRGAIPLEPSWLRSH